MDLVEQFLARYRKEFDFYDQAARIVAQKLESSLQAAGIRSMVTSRAKSLSRLEDKVRQRSPQKMYQSVENIFLDIVDLAGCRVALYFPGDREQVRNLIKSSFNLVGKASEFPENVPPSYTKRFSGYWATHYRVQVPERDLNETQKRYAEARVEIQVASVLMHGWSEVEHDLVYKPMQGRLSIEEYAILDELNGLVMAGEIALERLQRAGKNRVADVERVFINHYDLAAHLLDRATATQGPLGDSALGRVDLLFDLLVKANLATPGAIAGYIANLHDDVEKRPIAEQIVDQILAEDQTRYARWESIRNSRQIVTDQTSEEPAPSRGASHQDVGRFLEAWIAFERLVQDRGARSTTLSRPQTTLIPVMRLVQSFGVFERPEILEIDRIRRLRNSVVHGTADADSTDLREAADILEILLNKMEPPRPTKGKRRSRGSSKE